MDASVKKAVDAIKGPRSTAGKDPGSRSAASLIGRRDAGHSGGTPSSWVELAGAVESGRRGALLAAPRDALDRVLQAGDLCAPVLSLTQRLPG
jgi:hypothetical protein